MRLLFRVCARSIKAQQQRKVFHGIAVAKTATGTKVTVAVDRGGRKATLCFNVREEASDYVEGDYSASLRRKACQQSSVEDRYYSGVLPDTSDVHYARQYGSRCTRLRVGGPQCLSVALGFSAVVSF